MAQDRYRYFRIEANEILDGLSRGVLELERRAEPELIAQLLRLAHTLKGAARIVGHREIAELSHHIEDVLAPLRTAPVAQRHDEALALIDRMAVHVAALQQPAGTTQPVATTQPVPVASQGAPAPAAGPPPVSLPAPAQAVPRAAARPTSPPPAGDAALPRVHEVPVPRADPGALDDVLGGLAEIHALIRRLRGVEDVRQLEPRLDQLERELRAVRQDAERLRLLPAGTSFTSLERTARDVAHAAGKQVAFSASGADVRIDAQVLTTLHPALVQLVRNAVAHGIEVPGERAAAGKPPEGQVAIAVALHGSRIAITCRDDGRGMDLEAVRRAAIQRGLAADRARALDGDQLIGILLRGGISTSPQVTVHAGRGIGLDVAREAAQVLGGELTARTGPGGTAITITAPTSVAAVSALMLGAGDRTAALPLAAVRRVARAAAMTVLRSPGGLAVALDDVTVPLAPLARLLGADADRPPRAIVIVAAGDELAAIGADHVLGVDDIVVRTLPAGVPSDPIVWGVALDPEGLPRPILEPAALIAAAQAMPVAVSPVAVRPLPILVVDDSLTTRMLEQSILESAGYQVDTATSAEEGLVKLGRRSYGLILVDVEMPGMDGFEFITALRAQPELAAIPAILVTSRNRPDDLARGAAVGAQGYVVKSDFDQTTLLGMIHRLVLR